MEKITITISPEANKTEDIAFLREESAKIPVLVEEVKPVKHPTVSKYPLDLLQKLPEITQELLTAESILKISGGMIMKSILSSAYQKSKVAITNLIKANNRKKGNKFGAEIVVHREILNNKQTLRFIFDGIHESKIPLAIEQVNHTLNKFEDGDDKDLDKVEVAILNFNKQNQWKVVAVNFREI